jgi:hypothetical protein
VNAPARRPLLGEPFLAAVLAAMVGVLLYVRLEVVEGAGRGEAPAFVFENPLLDAHPGERVLFYDRSAPQNLSCMIVREEAVVLRPMEGPDRIGEFDGLKRQLPYLACEFHDLARGERGCAAGTSRAQPVIYALNYFGLPYDSQVRIDSMQPLRVRWGDRDVVVFEIVYERYGILAGTWRTYVTPEAPVAGLVKMTALRSADSTSEWHYQELLDVSGPGGG